MSALSEGAVFAEALAGLAAAAQNGRKSAAGRRHARDVGQALGEAVEQMGGPVLRIGGPLAIACGTCQQPPGMGCVTTDRGGMNTALPRKPHAARVKAAPPEQEARAGDLVGDVQGGARVFKVSGSR